MQSLNANLLQLQLIVLCLTRAAILLNWAAGADGQTSYSTHAYAGYVLLDMAGGSSINVDSLLGPPSYVLAHAVLMSVAFLLLLPMGMLFTATR